ncbi:MAG: hypothetical protein ACK456_01390 [Pseudanabaenaceae cyanobacterium]
MIFKFHSQNLATLSNILGRRFSVQNLKDFLYRICTTFAPQDLAP